MKHYKVYTDGACRGNPGPGGWGVAIVHNDKVDKLNGFDHETTNNRMELLAPIKGIQEIPSNSEIFLYTDSKYLKDGNTSDKIEKINGLQVLKAPLKTEIYGTT